MEVRSQAETTESVGMTRRKFIGTAAAALLVGVSIQIFGCGADEDSGTNPNQTPNNTGTVSNNHGHEAVITGAQLDAAGAVTLHIAGSAGHDHTVALTSNQVAMIKAGSQVLQESADGGAGHTHFVAFN
jgi:hypothetical protein